MARLGKLFAFLLALHTANCLATEKPRKSGDPEDKRENSLRFKALGFSIAPLEGTVGDAPYQTIMMFLPASGGFAPNVNIQIQPYKGSLSAYAELSKKQMKAASMTLLHEKIQAGALLLEYSGTSQGRKLHWYAKAQLADGRIYLATATATEQQWRTVADKLKACVESFRKDGVPKTGKSAE